MPWIPCRVFPEATAMVLAVVTFGVDSVALMSAMEV
jgi:hypothetical protein